MKSLFKLIGLIVLATMLLAACAPQPAAEAPAAEAPAAEAPAAPAATEAPAAPAAVHLIVWTKEDEAGGGLPFLQAMTDAYTAANPNVTFEIANKDVETLREDFQTSSLAGAAPDLLWTVSDHVGPFQTADLIQPVDGLFDMTQFVDSAVTAVQLPGVDGTWGVPIFNGNHLMLLYNKSLVAEAPADTDAFVAAAQAATKGDVYGFAYNATEPFWLVPWLGGFGGKVFAADGITPTLNTPEMVNTLQFLYDLKYTYKVTPAESDYNGADTMFKEGKAAMIINGDWSLSGYKDALGENFGVAPIPMVKSTGKYPAPYTSGGFWMLPKGLEGDKLAAVVDFVKFSVNDANQVDLVTKLNRLPALKTALESDVIKNDPILAGSAEQMTYGTPMPIVTQMRCNWDSMKPEMIAVLAGQETPADAAPKMQASADACVLTLE